MNWMLTELPSGEAMNRSVRTLSPVDGAITSVSIASRNAFMPAALAVADSVASSASISSRLATLLGVGSSKLANTALIRGSTRGSSASFDTTTSYHVLMARSRPALSPRQHPIGLSVCRKPPFVREYTQSKTFVALGRDLVALLLIRGDAADIGHEDTGLARNIGADIPRIGQRIESVISDFVVVLHPGILCILLRLDARQAVVAQALEAIRDPIDVLLA